MPLSKTFYYQAPESLKESIEIGKRVLVPLGKRRITGYVLGFHAEVDIEDVKDIIDVLDDLPLFSKDDLIFYRWVSNYYFSTLGEVIKTALPKGIDIETIQTLSITEKGAGFLASSDDNSLPCQVLKEILQNKGVTLKYLAKRLSGDIPHSLLFKLKDNGLVNMEFKEKARRVNPKTERFIRQKRERLSMESMTQAMDMLEKRAPKQAKILKFIRDRDKVSFRALRQEFGDSSVCVKRLKEKGLISIFSEEVYRDPFEGDDYNKESPPRLTKGQQEVLNRVSRSIESERFFPFLLYGVTGSGKTEIYIKSIEEALKLGKEAIVMVPEISLTPQLVSRFRSRFGNNIGLLHSGLSEGERYDEWRRIKRREVRIAIGVRSAVFTPFENIGIIIVDEEHETSYKQEEKLPYSARDLAIVRAKLSSAVVILGSATPSIESYNNSQKGKLTQLRLPERIGNKPLPVVEVLDMRDEVKDNPYGGLIFSNRLKEAIKETLVRKEQVLLFLNRRGFANFVICDQCGFIVKCPNCSVSLVHHLKRGALHCHYCSYSIQIPVICPECGRAKVQSFGLGTERVEEEVKRLFPNVMVARMDRDTTTRKKSHQKIIRRLEEGKTDILIGTQMIAKGHDLPGVTLVGVISADTSLGFPDFRASERTFQLLTQVAGRAGRGELPGRVVIQTFNPEHYSIQRARRHDFLNFFSEEMSFRRETNYPPFSRLIIFRITGNSERRTEKYAYELGKVSKDLLDRNRDFRKCIEILGPVAAPLERLKGKYRKQILIKGRKPNLLHSFARNVINNATAGIKSSGVKLSVDVDPINML